MKADDLIHEGSGQDDFIKDGDAAPHHASVAPLWVHSQVPLMAVPGTHTVYTSSLAHTTLPSPKGGLPS